MSAENTLQTPPGFTEQLSAQVAAASESDFSEVLYQHATLAFMDWLSVAVVARQEPVSIILLDQALNEGGSAQSSVIAYPHRLSVAQAARVNGTMSHAFDYDDTLLMFMGHPTATILPAVVALAEAQGLNGRPMLAAYLVGIQAGVWVAQAMGADHYRKGFHGTATIGRTAATAACAQLLGLSAEQTRNAFGIAGTQTGGLRRSFGSMAKPFHAGMAAEGGVVAAQLASSGFVAGDAIFEGQFGLFDAAHGQRNAVDMSAANGPHPVELLSPKIHAACHCTHAPIETILTLAEERSLSADDIESVQVYCSQISLDNANKTRPTSGLEAKFSINYSMANALIRKDTGLKGYTDAMVADAQVRELMARISVEVDDEHRDADLKTTCHFTLRSGEQISRTLDPVEQAPTLEIKRKQITQKFNSLCSMVYDDRQTAALKGLIEGLVDGTPVSEVISATQHGF